MPPDYLIRSTVKTPFPCAEVPMTSQDATQERLVRAKNQARAISHVVKDSVVATVASTDDVIRVTAAGVKLEIAE